jgi:hypothetical protein
MRQRRATLLSSPEGHDVGDGAAVLGEVSLGETTVLSDATNLELY